MTKLGILGVNDARFKEALIQYFSDTQEVIIFEPEDNHVEVAKRLASKNPDGTRNTDFELIATTATPDSLLSKIAIMAKKLNVKLDSGKESKIPEEIDEIDNEAIKVWLDTGSFPVPEAEDNFMDIWEDEEPEAGESIFVDENINDRIEGKTNTPELLEDAYGGNIDDDDEDDSTLDISSSPTPSPSYDLEEESDILPNFPDPNIGPNDSPKKLVGENYEVLGGEQSGKEETPKRFEMLGDLELKQDVEDLEDEIFFGAKNKLDDVEDEVFITEDSKSRIFDETGDEEYDYSLSREERELSEQLKRESAKRSHYQQIPETHDTGSHMSEINAEEKDRERVRVNKELSKEYEEDRYRPQKSERSAPSYIDVLPEGHREAQRSEESGSSLRSKLHNNMNSFSGSSRVYWVSGSSGGVGKTTVSWQTAITTAMVLNQISKKSNTQARPVFLIEADLKNSKLQNLLEVDHSLTIVADKILEQQANHNITDREVSDAVESAITVDGSGVRVLCAPYDISDHTTAQMKLLDISAAVSMQTIRERYKDAIIFVDAGNLQAPESDKFAKVVLKQPLVSVILVTGPSSQNADDTLRAIETLTCPSSGEKRIDRKTNNYMTKYGYGVDTSNIYVCINRMREEDRERRTKELHNFQEKLGSHTVIAGLIPELHDMASGEKGWVNDAPADIRLLMSHRTGRLISRCGLPEIGNFLDNSVKQTSDSSNNFIINFVNKFMSRNLD